MQRSEGGIGIDRLGSLIFPKDATQLVFSRFELVCPLCSDTLVATSFVVVGGSAMGVSVSFSCVGITSIVFKSFTSRVERLVCVAADRFTCAVDCGEDSVANAKRRCDWRKMNNEA